MSCVKAKLTVCFEAPFWVGIYERVQEGRLTAARVVFGAEPKDGEVYERFLSQWDRLRFSPPVVAAERPEVRRNPKRAQRAAAAALLPSGTGTKAQQALGALREQSAVQRRDHNRQRTEEAAARRFALRRQKKKQKHRGH